MSKLTKKQRILTALKSGRSITKKVALKQYNVQNLRATISDLRKNDGYSNIKTLTTKSGETKYAMA
jgi:hypothetical protein